ncbi:MAG: hypothetical protein M3477_05530, partial [Gemmatimonadota bacterium]|nr:hypothetical protein [Gemmatimonadota bacterium]
PLLGIALVAGHRLVLGVASPRPALSAVVVLGAAGLLAITHLWLAGVVHTLVRRRSRSGEG